MIASVTLPRAASVPAHPAHTDDAKWPVWARLVIITGLSALLWAGIISALVALFGGVP